MPTTFDYSGYGSWKREGSKRRWRPRLPNRYIRFLKGIERSRPVIELGCADGSFMEVMRQAGFTDVRGIDICPEYAGCEGVEIGDASEIITRAADASLGGVIALDVFEHIPQDDLRRLLVACRAKLAEGGQIVFRVPNAGAALGLVNQNGDLSHVNAFNEISVRQLAFDTGLRVVQVHSEPFAYPRSLEALGGLLLWPLYAGVTRAVFAAYGHKPKVITPNLICILAEI
jgi:predicted TPR repeat methyltransferase